MRPSISSMTASSMGCESLSRARSEQVSSQRSSQPRPVLGVAPFPLFFTSRRIVPALVRLMCSFVVLNAFQIHTYFTQFPTADRSERSRGSSERFPDKTDDRNEEFVRFR